MTRSEWKNLDENVKRGCYVAFTQQQKVDFWKGKFDEALKLGWSQEEIEHIKSVRQFVETHPIYFDYSHTKTDEEIEVFELFFYEWIKKAESQLGWDRQIIGGLIATGNSLLDKKGTIQVNQTRVMTKAGGEVNCNCSSKSNWCSIDIMVDCKTGGCDKVIDDCGTLWQYDCDGRCNGI